MKMKDSVSSLQDLTSTRIAIILVKTNIRWRKIRDVAFSLRDIIEDWKISPKLRRLIRVAIGNTLQELRRWDDKHREMFPENSKKGRVMDKSEHLRTFYSRLIWKHSRFEIDDYGSAVELMATECSNWPQMQFQFACLYAMQDVIQDDWKFDKYRRITLRKQLTDHPVYDFWLTLIESNWDVFFDTETRLANQKLQLCFKFAITHGYCELMKYIWDKIGANTREYIGMLQWRSMCYRARDRYTMNFLCEHLCQINAIGMARISWTAFWSTFYDMMNNEESDVIVEEKFKKRFEFLIQNSCPELRKRLLSMDNFRIVSDAFRFSRGDIFALLLQYMDGEQLRDAREIVDRIHDRRRSVEGDRLRRMMLRRQKTTAD